jgi:hypothetical protein
MNNRNLIREMASCLSRNHVRKGCALVAATLILPRLAHGEEHWALLKDDWRDHDRARENGASRSGDYDRDNNKNRPVPVVPEANAGWVLVPFFGAVLVFSSRQLFRAKA